MKEKSYMVSLKAEFPNGQIQSKLKEKEKNTNVSKNLKMMRLQEEKLMPKKRPINSN